MRIQADNSLTVKGTPRALEEQLKRAGKGTHMLSKYDDRRRFNRKHKPPTPTPESAPNETVELLKALATKMGLRVEVAAPPQPEPPPEAPRYTPAEERLLLDAAKESLRKYGSYYPPREVLYPVMTKTCPHCWETKPLVEGFGLKWRGKAGNRYQDPQPWCKACRNGKDSHPGRYGASGRKRRS